MKKKNLLIILPVALVLTLFANPVSALTTYHQIFYYGSESTVTGVSSEAVLCCLPCESGTYYWTGVGVYQDDVDYRLAEVGLLMQRITDWLYVFRVYASWRINGGALGTYTETISVSYEGDTIGLAVGRDGNNWRYYVQLPGQAWDNFYTKNFGFSWAGNHVGCSLEQEQAIFAGDFAWIGIQQNIKHQYNSGTWYNWDPIYGPSRYNMDYVYTFTYDSYCTWWFDP